MPIHARTRFVEVTNGHIGRSQFQRSVGRFEQLGKLLNTPPKISWMRFALTAPTVLNATTIALRLSPYCTDAKYSYYTRYGQDTQIGLGREGGKMAVQKEKGSTTIINRNSSVNMIFGAVQRFFPECGGKVFGTSVCFTHQFKKL